MRHSVSTSQEHYNKFWYKWYHLLHNEVAMDIYFSTADTLYSTHSFVIFRQSNLADTRMYLQ